MAEVLVEPCPQLASLHNSYQLVDPPSSTRLYNVDEPLPLHNLNLVAKGDVRQFFQYTPLNRQRQFVRLFTLLPIDENGRVQGILWDYELPPSNKSLDRLVSFEAVSYLWGTEKATTEILINDCVFYVRPNLYNFLKTYASITPQPHPNLWIDAICINEHNVNERNHQVARMTAIYRAADRVVVWLGTSADESDCVFDTLQAPEVLEMESILERFEGNLRDKEHYKGELRRQFLELGSKFKVPMSRICNREYWARMWIIQEILSARQITILCGDRMVPWSFAWSIAVEAATDWPNTSEDVTSNPRAASYFCKQRLRFRNTTRKSAGRKMDSLINLIITLGQGSCTDLHDKVYALIGLASDVTEFEVNYSQPLIEVYLQVVRLVEQASRPTRAINILELGNILGLSASHVYDKLWQYCLNAPKKPILQQILVQLDTVEKCRFMLPARSYQFLKDAIFCECEYCQVSPGQDHLAAHSCIYGEDFVLEVDGIADAWIFRGTEWSITYIASTTMWSAATTLNSPRQEPQLLLYHDSFLAEELRGLQVHTWLREGKAALSISLPAYLHMLFPSAERQHNPLQTQVSCVQTVRSRDGRIRWAEAE